MRIVDFQIPPDCRQYSVGGIEERVRTGIILRSEPLPFHYPPKGLDNVQVRGIGRDVEKKKSPLFPYRAHLPNFCIPVHAGIVKNYKGLFVDPEGILFEKINNLLGVDGLTRGETLEAVVPVNHSKDIKPFGPFRWDMHVFSGELPPVWDVALGAYMRFISIEEVDFSPGIKLFKFLQLSGLVLVELRRGYTPWTFPYTSISCANADKKRLKVKSLASLPEDFSQASLAERTLCLSDSMALRTASSSEQSMMGLRPCPGRVCKPLIPSDSNRFTQPLTLWAVIPVCSPTHAELNPSDLSNTARQRIRKQWLAPVRKPSVSSPRSDFVNINILIFICIYYLDASKIRQFYYM